MTMQYGLLTTNGAANGAPAGGRIMAYKSRFSGARCAKCLGTINKGDAIAGQPKGTVPRLWYHVRCSALDFAEPPQATVTAYSAEAADHNQDLGDIDEPIDITPEPTATISKPRADRDLLDIIAEGLAGRMPKQEIDAAALETLREDSAKALDRVVNLIDALSAKVAALESNPKAQPLSVILTTPTAAVQIDNAHKQVPQLATLIALRRNLYLWDSTGGGKTHAVRQVADALGLRCAAVSFSRQSPVYWITGYMDAVGKFSASTFYDFYKNGGVYDAEELDDASADLLVTLNVGIDNGCMTFANGETVSRHADFVFVGCGNTAGRGASPRYPERKPFDAAFGNRLTYLRWTYDETLEESVALAINPNAGKYIAWTRAARAAAAELALRLEITPRTTFTLARLAPEKTITDQQLIESVMAGIDQPSIDKLLARVAFPERQVS